MRARELTQDTLKAKADGEGDMLAKIAEAHCPTKGKSRDIPFSINLSD